MILFNKSILSRTTLLSPFWILSDDGNKNFGTFTCSVFKSSKKYSHFIDCYYFIFTINYKFRNKLINEYTKRLFKKKYKFSEDSS